MRTASETGVPPTIASLAAWATGLGDGHSRHADVVECVFHDLEPIRLEDCCHEFKHV